MSRHKKSVFYLALTLVVTLALAFSLAQTPKKTEELTPFEQKCSACHSLETIRLDMERVIKELHQKAGIQLSAEAIKEVQKSFTLDPVKEPHEALFRGKCAKCHSIQEVVLAHQTKDEAEMKKIIQRMASKEKSGISQEEIEKIHQSMNMLNEIYEKDVEVKPEPKSERK